MLVPRLIGAGLIVVGGIMYGAGLARSLRLRAREIDQLETALRILETEIAFTQTPLPEACERIAQGIRGSVRLLFEDIARRLSAQGGDSVCNVWAAAVSTWSGRAQIQAEELAILSALGATLGRTSAEEQVRSIRYTTERLKTVRERLEADLEKQSRLRLYLGAAGGLALAILLV